MNSNRAACLAVGLALLTACKGAPSPPDSADGGGTETQGAGGHPVGMAAGRYYIASTVISDSR